MRVAKHEISRSSSFCRIKSLNSDREIQETGALYVYFEVSGCLESSNLPHFELQRPSNHSPLKWKEQTCNGWASSNDVRVGLSDQPQPPTPTKCRTTVDAPSATCRRKYKTSMSHLAKRVIENLSLSFLGLNTRRRAFSFLSVGGAVATEATTPAESFLEGHAQDRARNAGPR